ncbi:MAG TPA: radical SAM protein [bacterium]|nr:radical SAM protein [bacterium]
MTRPVQLLLLNPSDGFRPAGFVPHLGFALMAAALPPGETVVADYNSAPALPHPGELLRTCRPAAVGITAYTPTWPAASRLIDEVRRHYDGPLLLGGPHTQSYAAAVADDTRIDYVVTGEADAMFTGGENWQRQSRPQLRNLPPMAARDIGSPALDAFLRWEEINGYPLMTSRGCPYRCAFCVVPGEGQRGWRPRPLDDCLAELEHWLPRLPRLRRLVINDDCFTLDLERAKEFLDRYLTVIHPRYPVELQVSNIRADRIDAAFLVLLRRAGATKVGLGIEHLVPEVFAGVGKGETLETIVAAVKLVRAAGLQAGGCLIVGLPGDTPARSRECVRRAAALGLDFHFWNLMIAYRGTAARDWFERHGRVLAEAYQPLTAPGMSLQPPVPHVETDEFPARARQQAWLHARLNTERLLLRTLLRALPVALRYGVVSDWAAAMAAAVQRRAAR